MIPTGMEERELKLMMGAIPFPPMEMRFLVGQVKCAVAVRVIIQVLLISQAMCLLRLDLSKLPPIPILQPSGSPPT